MARADRAAPIASCEWSVRRGSAETPAYLLLAMDLWDCSARSLLDDRNRRIKVRRRACGYLTRKPVSD